MSEPMWAADIDVDGALASKLVAGQFSEFTGAAVEPFGIGWDNAAFLIDGRVVFRFPRRRAFANLIEREIRLLPSIALRVPLPISAPQWAGTGTAEYPWVFAGYRMLPGSTACSAALSDAERSALARPLGSFLRALHGIETTPLLALGLTGDEIGRLDHEKRMRAARERLGFLAALNALADPDIFERWLAANPPRQLGAERRRLVHGDLYARHVLLDERTQVSGVIDWGDVHLGDPAIDLAIAHLLLPSGAHAAFREAYGAVDDDAWQTARYRAVYHAILELDYGLRENDAGMQRIGSAALELLRPSLI